MGGVAISREVLSRFDLAVVVDQLGRGRVCQPHSTIALLHLMSARILLWMLLLLLLRRLLSHLH